MNVKRQVCMIFGVYGILWTLTVISFWFIYRDSQMAMLQIIAARFVILPVLTFILSIILGRTNLPGRYMWSVPICFSVAYLLNVMFTQSLGQYILAGVAAFPGGEDFVAIIVVSLVGLLVGVALRKLFKRD